MTKRSTIKGRVFGRLPIVATVKIAMASVAASVAIALVTGASNTVRAEGALTMPLPAGIGTCKDLCPVKGIQFKPGQRITVQVVNRTKYSIAVENLAGSKPVILSGLKTIEFSTGGNSDLNPSIVMWEKNETPLRVKLSQPKPDQLVIELRFAAQRPGDQSVYLRNDGKVDVF